MRKKKVELHRYGKSWTQREENLLKKLYPGSFTHELVERLGRTAVAIRTKASELGIRKNWFNYNPDCVGNRKPWSDKERELLEKLYPTTPNDQLLKHFPKRNIENITGYANSLGLKKDYLNSFTPAIDYTKKLWHNQKDLLIELYPTTTNEELAKMFGRTKSAIDAQATKLGLHKPGYKPHKITKGRLWSKEEDALIKKMYSSALTKDLAQKLNRTVKAVNSRAELLNIQKDPDKYIPPPAYHAWPDKDTQKLRKLWQQGYSRTKIAEILGKSYESIKYQIRKQIKDFGLMDRKDPHQWSKKEIAYLVKHYKTKTNRQISEFLERPIPSIIYKAGRLGLSGTAADSWTKREINILKKFYSQLTYDEIAKKIGGRTIAAISSKARKLGLTK